MSALSAVLSTGIGHCRKFRKVSYMECTGQGNDFELIPMVKIKTRNAIECYFGSEFLAICNHCRVIAAQSRKRLKNFEKCLRFLG